MDAIDPIFFNIAMRAGRASVVKWGIRPDRAEFEAARMALHAEWRHAGKDYDLAVNYRAHAWACAEIAIGERVGPL